MTRKGYILWLIAALLPAVSCGRQGAEPASPETSISFETKWTPLRATLVTGAEQVTGFSASAFIYSGEWATFEDLQGYFINKAVSVDGSQEYDTGYPWLNDDRKFAFVAWYPSAPPYDAEAEQLLPFYTYLTYSVPRTLSKQVDLMGAFEKDVPVSHGQPVALTFKHLLGALTFTVGKEFATGTIKSLKVKNALYQGSIDLSLLDNGVRWDPTDAVADFTVATNISHTTGTDTRVNAGSPFMMIPTQMPEGTAVELVMTIGGVDQTFTADVAGRGVVAGENRTVRMSPSEITLGGIVLPWTHTAQKTGFLHPDAVRVVGQPYWTYPPSTEPVREVIGYAGEPADQPVTLNLQFAAPLGVTWRATLTNGLDFWFGEGADIKGGIITENTPIHITIYPRHPQGSTRRTTEVYFTVGGVEVEPDVTDQASGEPINWYPGVSHGSDNRFKVIQEVKQ